MSLFAVAALLLTAAPAEPADAAAPADGAVGVGPTRAERFHTHRAVGVAAQVLMISTTALYAFDDWDRFGGGPRGGNFAAPTTALATSTELMMLLNLYLAMSAPERQTARPGRAIVHLALMGAATVANLVRLAVGLALAPAQGSGSRGGLVDVWRATAIAAPVLSAAGMTLMMF